jgi:hypothetical protein
LVERSQFAAEPIGLASRDVTTGINDELDRLEVSGGPKATPIDLDKLLMILRKDRRKPGGARLIVAEPKALTDNLVVDGFVLAR